MKKLLILSAVLFTSSFLAFGHTSDKSNKDVKKKSHEKVAPWEVSKPKAANKVSQEKDATIRVSKLR